MNSRVVLILVVGPLLAVAGCGDSSTGADEDRIGVSGTVHLGPQCPVETVDEPCQDTPAADVTVIVAERVPGDAYVTGATVATGKTDATGAFRIDAPPGEYVVTAQEGMSCELMDVVVVAGAYVDVDLPCDTGIRTPTG